MFPRNYFPAAYFTPRYFPPAEGEEPIPVARPDAGAYEEDPNKRLNELIEEDNELMELFAILLAAIAED